MALSASSAGQVTGAGAGAVAWAGGAPVRAVETVAARTASTPVRRRRLAARISARVLDLSKTLLLVLVGASSRRRRRC
jgi:hypothetical protein